MKLKTALLTGLLCTAAAHAHSYTMTFDQAAACAPAVCGNGSSISQTYGDVAGVADISFTDVNNPQRSLRWWDASYSNLQGVVWADGGDANSHGRIEIKSLNGGAVTLNRMDFGAWPITQRGTTIVVTAIGGGAPLFSFAGTIGTGGLLNSFSPNVTSTNGLWIEWSNSAFNVGIDNVNFSVSAVPEPESYALLLAGLGLIGVIQRRKRAV